jgi:ferredoxin-NADP reductase/MOSC domain-containing protein YiiM/ferredoxin
MLKLLSVNVGLPQEIEWQGKRVRTAIWKHPVPHRVHVRRLNIDGDRQADLQGHGGEQRAVMVYQIEACRYWAKQLGWSDFEFGQFGENFTVEGLADDEVCIGDQYRIGDAVFEVTQPRVTCYRLGIRLNTPQLPALLVAHRKPGFYLRVLEEGEVGPGDEIRKIADGPGQMSVAEIDSLLYLPNPDYHRIRIAVSLPALSTGWKDSFDKLLRAKQQGRYDGNAGLTSSTSPPPAWKAFRPLKVIQVHQETGEVTSIILASPDGLPLPEAIPGQYLVLRLGKDEARNPIIRSYSISGESNSGTYRISVKRGVGRGSQQLVDRTRVGDLIESSAARGDFVLRSSTRPIVFISAGIGVTPLLSMLHRISKNYPENPRTVWWIHGTRRSNVHAFRNEIQELLISITGSRSLIVYSSPDPTDCIGSDFDVEGHIDLETLRGLALPLEAEFYLCGPSSFLKDMHSALDALGVTPDAIHQEVFGVALPAGDNRGGSPIQKPHLPVQPGEQSLLISFSRTGLTVPWDNRFKSILELAEAWDVPVRWSCRTGVCHVCECGLLEGQLRYDPDPLEQPATGNALICCSTPKSPITLDL